MPHSDAAGSVIKIDFIINQDVENDGARISQEELDALIADNSKAGSFVRDNFKDLFFADGVHRA